MSDRGSIADRLARLIRARAPYAHCDTCLAFDLGTALQEAQRAALVVARGGTEFERKIHLCHGCQRTVELTCRR